jgi:hypothetical protein
MLNDAMRDEVRKGAVDSSFDILRPYFSEDPETRRSAAFKTVSSILDSDSRSKLTTTDMYALALSWDASTSALPGYATLQPDHIQDITKLRSTISSYAEDRTRRRPLTFLLLAPPGSGKSHLIDCISKSLSSYAIVSHSFNMASMLSADDLSAPLDEVRNTKVADKLPLLFLDEFDASPANFGLLLPLLWDGQLNLRHRNLSLGKLIVVLAGSTKGLPEALAHAVSMQSSAAEDENSKLPDLLSRINGSVVTLPPLDAGAGARGRPADKIVIAVQLLRRRFAPKLRRVPLGLLRLISKLHFRYDVRSMSQLIDRIDWSTTATTDTLSLSQIPPELRSVDQLRGSPLVYHLIDDKDGAHGVVEHWKECAEHTCPVPLYAPTTALVTTEEEIKMTIAYALETLKTGATRPTLNFEQAK